MHIKHYLVTKFGAEAFEVHKDYVRAKMKQNAQKAANKENVVMEVDVGSGTGTCPSMSASPLTRLLLAPEAIPPEARSPCVARSGVLSSSFRGSLKALVTPVKMNDLLSE